MQHWRSGLELARAFHADVVEPVVDVPYAAALIGEGSEVLGYDSERSTDHEWGPRLQVFVAAEHVQHVRSVLDAGLPERYRGWPTRWFSLQQGRVDHHLEIDTVEQWRAARLPTLRREPDTAAWLAAPQQHLLQLTAGAVFRDDLGDLSALRQTYAWYPTDVWRWLLASQWHLIGNTEPLLARTIDSEDTRGARLLTGRLVQLIMELALLQRRRYQPYPKWFGRAFADLGDRDLGVLLDAALDTTPVIGAGGPLQRALLHVAHAQVALGITAPVEPGFAPFAVGVNEAVRPFPVLNSGAIITACVESITDPRLADLPRVGALDQLTHGDDQLINFTGWPALLADDYRRQLRP